MLNGQAMPVNFPASKWAGKECFSTDAEEQSGWVHRDGQLYIKMSYLPAWYLVQY